ncbi:MAG: hypothetical protein MUO94_04675 [Thermoplasmata archaeon]|nr:hypothetical protein [Thermoplasmata archaeon]
MRTCWSAGGAVAVTLIMLMSSPAVADVPLPGSPTYANNILGGFVTPTVAPGDDVHFSFNVSNPYDDADAVMTDLVLTVGIYRYATQEEAIDVDADFTRPPTFDGETTETNITFNALELGNVAPVDLTIYTQRDTPHGSYFSQSTYFIRFSLSFRFEGNESQVVLQSRGCFTEEEWDTLVSFETGDDIVNVTYMHSLGVDGLLPDSSFGIKIPIPRWPLALLVSGCGFVSFLALYYFVLDNPGKYPRLEKRFYQLRGKLNELRGKLENRGG